MRDFTNKAQVALYSLLLLVACFGLDTECHEGQRASQLPQALERDPQSTQVDPELVVRLTSDDFTCVVAPSRKVFRVGDEPEVVVRVRNNAAIPVFLPGSLDGSWRAARYPVAGFQILGPPGGVLQAAFGVCGVTNRPRQADFQLVESGESFDPYQSLDDGGFFGSSSLRNTRFGVGGQYTIYFRYDTTPPSVQDWWGVAERSWPLGDIDPELSKRIQGTPRISILCSAKVLVEADGSIDPEFLDSVEPWLKDEDLPTESPGDD